MKDIRYEKLANNLLTYSVNIQKGEHILIEILGEEGIPLAKQIIKEAENTINNYVNRLQKMAQDEEEIHMRKKYKFLQVCNVILIFSIIISILIL